MPRAGKVSWAHAQRGGCLAPGRVGFWKADIRTTLLACEELGEAGCWELGQPFSSLRYYAAVGTFSSLDAFNFLFI